MNKLIFIWLFQKLTYIAEAVQPAFTGITVCLFIFAIGLVFFLLYATEDFTENIKKIIFNISKRMAKVGIVSLVLTIITLSVKAVRLSDTEYTAAVSYCIGAEIINSPAGEKVVEIIDTKLNNWVQIIKETSNQETK